MKTQNKKFEVVSWLTITALVYTQMFGPFVPSAWAQPHYTEKEKLILLKAAYAARAAALKLASDQEKAAAEKALETTQKAVAAQAVKAQKEAETPAAKRADEAAMAAMGTGASLFGFGAATAPQAPAGGSPATASSQTQAASPSGDKIASQAGTAAAAPAAPADDPSGLRTAQVGVVKLADNGNKFEPVRNGEQISRSYFSPQDAKTILTFIGNRHTEIKNFLYQMLALTSFTVETAAPGKLDEYLKQATPQVSGDEPLVLAQWKSGDGKYKDLIEHLGLGPEYRVSVGSEASFKKISICRNKWNLSDFLFLEKDSSDGCDKSTPDRSDVMLTGFTFAQNGIMHSTSVFEPAGGLMVCKRQWGVDSSPSCPKDKTFTSTMYKYSSEYMSAVRIGEEDKTAVKLNPVAQSCEQITLSVRLSDLQDDFEWARTRYQLSDGICDPDPRGVLGVPDKVQAVQSPFYMKEEKIWNSGLSQVFGKDEQQRDGSFRELITQNSKLEKAFSTYPALVADLRSYFDPHVYEVKNLDRVVRLLTNWWMTPLSLKEVLTLNFYLEGRSSSVDGQVVYNLASLAWMKDTPFKTKFDLLQTGLFEGPEFAFGKKLGTNLWKSNFPLRNHLLVKGEDVFVPQLDNPFALTSLLVKHGNTPSNLMQFKPVMAQDPVDTKKLLDGVHRVFDYAVYETTLKGSNSSTTETLDIALQDSSAANEKLIGLVPAETTGALVLHPVKYAERGLESLWSSENQRAGLKPAGFNNTGDDKKGPDENVLNPWKMFVPTQSSDPAAAIDVKLLKDDIAKAYLNAPVSLKLEDGTPLKKATDIEVAIFKNTLLEGVSKNTPEDNLSTLMMNLLEGLSDSDGNVYVLYTQLPEGARATPPDALPDVPKLYLKKMNIRSNPASVAEFTKTVGISPLWVEPTFGRVAYTSLKSKWDKILDPRTTVSDPYYALNYHDVLYLSESNEPVTGTTLLTLATRTTQLVSYLMTFTCMNTTVFNGFVKDLAQRVQFAAQAAASVPSGGGFTGDIMKALLANLRAGVKSLKGISHRIMDQCFLTPVMYTFRGFGPNLQHVVRNYTQEMGLPGDVPDRVLARNVVDVVQAQRTVEKTEADRMAQMDQLLAEIERLKKGGQGDMDDWIKVTLGVVAGLAVLCTIATLASERFCGFIGYKQKYEDTKAGKAEKKAREEAPAAPQAAPFQPL
jgi:hypothetical protein